MKSGIFSKIAVVFSFTAVSAFIIAVLYCNLHGAIVPDSLIYSVFGFFGLECGVLAYIKGVKEKSTRDTEEAKGEACIQEA